ncbi:MAG: hypothetical protein AAB409_03520 [Gemmatimonadota bacterium]
MSSSERRAASDLGGMSRRELVAAMARWTVPTVLTVSLGARAAYAAASCPPCTKKTGGKCKACTTSQILNCQCEPCLGPPYCSGAGAAPAFGGAPSAERFGATSRGSSQTQELYRALRRRRANETDNLFAPPFGNRADSLFGRAPRTPFGRSGQETPDVRRLRERAQATQGLYDRLRQFDDRRRP